MDCADEFAHLRAALQPLLGADAIGVDVLNGKLTIEYAVEELSPDALTAAIAKDVCWLAFAAW